MELQFHPSDPEFMQLAARGDIVPVWAEVLADLETPLSAFLKIDTGRFAFLLESVEGGEVLARYSFLGAWPVTALRTKGHSAWLDTNGETREEEIPPGQTPLELIRRELGRERYVAVPGLPRFVGGAVGYIGYDTVRFFERLPDSNPDDLNIPDTYFLFVDDMVIFDHVRQRMLVLCNARVRGGARHALGRAKERIGEIVETLRRPLPAGKVASLTGARASLQLASNFAPAEYHDLVARAKEYIRAGDIIQVVPSQRWTCPVNARPLDVYRALRSVNPSPYMYYLSLDRLHLIGSSPEVLVSEEAGRARVRPIAGTAPRGTDPKQDELLARALLADEKERAEHVMLVDLGRNDLGRVCEYGSVKVDNFMFIEKYSHVMHIVSNVVGRLRRDCDQFDLLRASFPAGTVSGAPKIRAMEIIDELENTRRGPYAGAIGYFSLSGNMDTCITIRTILIKDGRAHLQAGGGIVADSDPQREYQETVNKANALVASLEMAEASG